MKCIHIGSQMGDVITTCCGSKRESRLPLYECKALAEGLTVETFTGRSNAAIEINGAREMRRIAGCQRCGMFQADVTLPQIPEASTRGPARIAWEKAREQRASKVPSIASLKECFLSHVPQSTTAAIHTRHLLYHIWPKAGSAWREHVANIERRLPLFNGRKIVSIVEDDDTEDIQIPWADKLLRMKNEPKRGEVVTFVPKLEEVANIGPDEAVFYCHGKGARHPVGDHATTVHLWSDIMLEVLLDHWRYIEIMLATYPIVGAFKKLGQSLAPTAARWHYTGTFYWLRNDIFTRNWRVVDQQYWGSESWPGIHFTEDEGGCAFLSGSPARLNLYDMNFMLAHVVPRLELFRDLMLEYRT